MIEFSGKIDKEIQAKVITKRGQFLGILGIILGILGLLGCLIFWLVEKKLGSDLIKLIVISCACVIIFGIILIPTSRKRLMFVWDYDIKIEEGIITVVSNHQSGVVQTHKTYQIEKVVDYGRFYYLFFYPFDMSKGIVCQKNLLINGTIEEFENLFKGKIKRKLK